MRPDPASSPEDSTVAFLSYARVDLDWATAIKSSLEEHGISVRMDMSDILPGEVWQDRLSRAIEESDTLVFVLSPASCASDVAMWEVAHASRLGKRIIPVGSKDLNETELPQPIAQLHILDWHGDQAAERLAQAVREDHVWSREATRLAQLAGTWERANESHAHLLRDDALAQAERWYAERAPHVHLAASTERFLKASRALQDTARLHARRTIVLAPCYVVAILLVLQLLILIPSVSRFRLSHLENSADLAQIASFAILANQSGRIDPELERELLRHAGAETVVIRRNDAQKITLSGTLASPVSATFDLRDPSATTLIADALSVLLRREERLIRVIASPQLEGGVITELVVRESRLREAMWRYSTNIFVLSLIVSLPPALVVTLLIRRRQARTPGG